MTTYLDAAIRRCALPIEVWFRPYGLARQMKGEFLMGLGSGDYVHAICQTPAEARAAYLALVAQFEAGERSGK